MSRRRFRRLEVDPAPAPPATERPTEEPLFRRSLELEDGGTTDLGRRPSQEPPPPAPPSQAPAPTGDADALATPAPDPAADAEPGFGSVVAAGALTACTFALVSIPVRAAFALGFGEGRLWKGASELLLVVAITLVLRRALRRPLGAL